MSSSTSSRHALVFGASGITGWALTRELLRYPTTSTFQRVIGLTNRPLTKSASLFPEDERLELYSGVNLQAGPAAVELRLKEINGIDAITHVYFTAYVDHGKGFEWIKKSNVEILENAIRAVEKLCPGLQFCTFQTGGKWYGFEFVDRIGFPATPLQESMPRIPEPYASNIMYYAQYDKLAELSKGKNWSFVEVRPDGITGFVPSNNAMNLAQALGLFLSFYADHEDVGVPVPYPGPPTAYTALHTDVSQSLLAHFHIYASLHPEKTARNAFNVGDDPSGVAWATIWPRICAYFGLKGIGPMDEGYPDRPFDINTYMQAHRSDWVAWVSKHGLKEGALEGTDFSFLTIMLGLAVFGRQYDLHKMQVIGFTETRDTFQGYIEAFELMKKAKIIP